MIILVENLSLKAETKITDLHAYCSFTAAFRLWLKRYKF